MDVSRLITIVQNYEELYNLRHPHYSNQQRRDNIWEEIGRKLNQTGNACKEKWTRVRDNHRKALHLRKTKSGQAVSKLKPPKYAQELTFLMPYLNDEEDRLSNISPATPDSDKEETQRETASLAESSDTQSSTSSIKSQIVRRKSTYSASQGPSTANILQEYLKKKETALNFNNSDPIIEFFINMAKTVKTFPIQDQVLIKAQLFQMVNNVEMRLAFPSSPPPVVTLSPPPENVRIIANELHCPPPTANTIFSETSNSKEMLPPTYTSTKTIIRPSTSKKMRSGSNVRNNSNIHSPSPTSNLMLSSSPTSKVILYLPPTSTAMSQISKDQATLAETLPVSNEIISSPLISTAIPTPSSPLNAFERTNEPCENETNESNIVFSHTQDPDTQYYSQY